MKAVQPEVLVDPILAGRVVIVHARYVTAFVCLTRPRRILIDCRLGEDTGVVEDLREQTVGVEEEYRDIRVCRSEVIEEESHTIVEVIDVRAFDQRIWSGHVWTAVNWWNIVKKEVAGSIMVQLDEELEWFSNSSISQVGLLSRAFGGSC